MRLFQRGFAALTAPFVRPLAAALFLSAAVVPIDAATVTHKVRMYWNFGEIEVELYGVETPRHVANFLRYADAGNYDNTFVHRVQAGSARFVQGGGFYVPDPLLVSTLVNSPVPSYPEIDNEFDASNGLSNTPGSLAAARTNDPDSATNQWFFNVTNNAGAFDPGPYTVFGDITEGFDWFDDVPYLTQLQQVFPETAGSYESTTPLAFVEDVGYVPIALQNTIEIPVQPGDFNLDGFVDAADELVWQAGQGDYSTANLVADADSDRDVDADDRAIWQANLGQGTLIPDVTGDYNRDGQVTEADYYWWETTAGSTESLYADGNQNGVIDAGDYTLWRDRLASASSVTIPEPSSLGLLVLFAGTALCGRPR